MKKMPRIALFSGLLVLASQPRLMGQSPVPVTPTCAPDHRVIAPRNPTDLNGAIVPGQSLTQARIELGDKRSMRIVEHPQTGKDLDAYNSTIVVQGGPKVQAYPLKDLVKFGEFFRIVETARLCSAPDAGTVFLAFEAGSTGAAEVFTVVQYSPRAVTVRGLPEADYGRIVVRSPAEVEVWTAGQVGPGVIDSNATERPYTFKTCHLTQEGVRCSNSTKTVGPISPAKFIGARIEVR
jgi:hypothetical protein